MFFGEGSQIRNLRWFACIPKFRAPFLAEPRFSRAAGVVPDLHTAEFLAYHSRTLGSARIPKFQTPISADTRFKTGDGGAKNAAPKSCIPRRRFVAELPKSVFPKIPNCFGNRRKSAGRPEIARFLSGWPLGPRFRLPTLGPRISDPVLGQNAPQGSRRRRRRLVYSRTVSCRNHEIGIFFRGAQTRRSGRIRPIHDQIAPGAPAQAGQP